ncbi:MAG: ATP-binding protein [Jatrophihabitans sp.]|uniref:ATP-binding protein n=1 Tax=Jatrophihabitans sp. TaxID=1932789 RepID=UPI003F7FE8A4
MPEPSPVRPHPRTLGWFGTSAIAMGGSNQSLFLITALVVAQGSAAVPLLVVGLLLAWAAAPGWTELSLMWPDRIGGIAATCSEAFRRYNPVFANLTGVCYWWGWVPTCGLTALLAAEAVHDWYLPGVPVPLMATAIVISFTVLNLCGIGRVTAVVRVIAVGSAGLAFLSALVPIVAGDVDVHRATSWHLTQPFHGVFGGISSAMAGLYLIGFAAPAFEAATCHVGEMKDPVRSLPRAMKASAGMAGLYFLVLPVVWLGLFGASGLGGADRTGLAHLLGPTFAPLLGAAAHSAAIWFMVLNMLHGTAQPLAGAARTLSQLADDGLLPVTFGRRNRFDAPVVATLLTAGLAIIFLLAGDPVWMIAAANFTYLIGIAMPSVAVWLLRRDSPDRERPWRAPRGTVALGLGAAVVWLIATILGFRQFGLPVVLFGLALAYSGSAFYAWRRHQDRVASGRERVPFSLHFKLTGAMLLVLALDGAGYLLAVTSSSGTPTRTAILEDIFVAVAILTISVGLILPGMVAHSVIEVADVATGLASGTLTELTEAMHALGRGELDAARATPAHRQVAVTTRDEVGTMAAAFNEVLIAVGRAAVALDHARDALRTSGEELARENAEELAVRQESERALLDALDQQRAAAERLRGVDEMRTEVVATVSHELRTPLTTIGGYLELLLDDEPDDDRRQMLEAMDRNAARLSDLVEDLLALARLDAEVRTAPTVAVDLTAVVLEAVDAVHHLVAQREQVLDLELDGTRRVMVHGDPRQLDRAIVNVLANAAKYTPAGGRVTVRLDIVGDRAQLAVTDTGVGIPRAEQDKLFDRFFRASTAQDTKGTGLGLAIVKTIVDRHAGELTVESTPGLGSTFTISLPLAAQLAALRR